MRTTTQQKYPLLPDREHVIRLTDGERQTLARAAAIFDEMRTRAVAIDADWDDANIDTDLGLAEHICRDWSTAIDGLTIEGRP